MSTTALHKYIAENSNNGQLKCRFVNLRITNTNLILPCGCGMDSYGDNNEIILLHHGNTLYCCGKQIRHDPRECHATINVASIQTQTMPSIISSLSH